MATGVPERSSALRNSPFRISKWGIQRHMKCIKVDSSSDGSRPSHDSGNRKRRSLILKFARSSIVIPLRLGETNQPSHHVRKSPSESAENVSREGIEDFRDKKAKSLFRKDDVEEQEKIPEEIKTRSLRRRKPSSSKEPTVGLSNENQSNDLRTEERSVSRKRGRILMAEADPVKFSLQLAESLFRKDDVEEQEKIPDEVKTRSLRRRKPSSSKVPTIGLSNENQSNDLRTEERSVTRKRGRSLTAEAEPVKFSLQLTRTEIEEDLKQILGGRPQRRPKKRPRNVQQLINNVIPGLYVSEVTPDLYKIREVAERKRR